MRSRTFRSLRRISALATVLAALAGASTSAGASQPITGPGVRTSTPVVESVQTPASPSDAATRGTTVQLVPQPLPGCESTRVFTVGDSLTVGVVAFADYSGRLLRAGFAPTNVASVGKPTSWGTSRLLENIAVGAVGGIVVAGLGTNDARWATPTTVEAFRQRVDDFMRAAGYGRTVVWVNLQLGKPGLSGSTTLMAQGALLNRVLEEQTLVWPNLVVLDWNSTPNRQYLEGDQVHYSGPGYRNRAAAIVDAVKAVSCRGG